MSFTKQKLSIYHHYHGTYYQYRLLTSSNLNSYSIQGGCFSEMRYWRRQKWTQTWQKLLVLIKPKTGSGIFYDLCSESRVACNVLLQNALLYDCKNENKHLNCSHIHSPNSRYQAKFISSTDFSKDTPRLNLASWPLRLFKFGVSVISCEDKGLSQTGQARAVQASPQKFCWYNTILTCKTSAGLTVCLS